MKPKPTTLAIRLLALQIACMLASAHGAEVPPGQTFQLENSELSAYVASVRLPADGFWIPNDCDDSNVVEWHLLPSTAAREKSHGERYQAAMVNRRIDSGRWKLRSLYWELRAHAKKNNDRSPKLLDELESKRDLTAWKSQSPWTGKNEDEYTETVKPPYLHYFPRTHFQFEDDTVRVSSENRLPLGVELTPYVNDGKHWVLYTDGNCQRVEIDEELMREHQLTIRPVRDESKPSLPMEAAKYTLVAVAAGAADVSKCRVRNLVTYDEIELSWDRRESTATDGEGEAARLLAKARKETWSPYIKAGSPTLEGWANTRTPTTNRRRGRTTNAFSVLGGRAAVEETLQLQNLAVISTSQRERTIEIDRIPGVAVPSHPFGEMLGDSPGGTLALANYVPTDRFMLYVAKPQTILPLLDDGGAFLAMTGAGATGNRLDYGLAKRYFKQFGLTRDWLEMILKTGLVREFVVTTPDLFFIDGTELTVVARLEKPELIQRMSMLLGVKDLGAGRSELKSASGDGSFWTVRDDLLLISTHAGELDRTVRLVETKGVGSMGHSEEFRYMLTQVPVTKSTRAMAYFSDAFIRRLVGPRVKIGQYRRMLARAAMESITSSMLRAHLDGVAPDATVDELANLGYVSREYSGSHYRFTDTRSVESSVYGPLVRMNSLSDLGIENATAGERDAYKQYVDNYSRFWRQFFDPIALRLDDEDDGSLELTTFILPLIDSSIYNGLKSQMKRHEDKTQLTVPKVSPTPVIQLSANLQESVWENAGRQWFGFGQQFLGLSPAILDDFGPSVHLAIFDADPVIAIGSGDILSSFTQTNRAFGRGTEMIAVPALLSVLTRPCSIFIETQNPERTTRILRHAANHFTAPERNSELNGNFYQLQDRDSWILQMDIVGIINLRFGIEVNGKYLVIRNIPWSATDRMVGSETLALNGAALSVSPLSTVKQRASLAASAASLQRRAAMNSIGRLYPLVASRFATAETAQSAHRQLYGFTPVHAPGGTWIWQNNGLESTVFGSVVRQRLPTPEDNQSQGLLNRIERLQLNMQFEDAGLRSTIRWRYRK